MNRTRTALAVIIAVAGIAAPGMACAQTLAPVPSAKTSSEPSAVTRVETWTKKQWDAAQKEWAKDKAKWADCEKQSDAQKLSGRSSWSFLYQCRTS